VNPPLARGYFFMVCFIAGWCFIAWWCFIAGCFIAGCEAAWAAAGMPAMAVSDAPSAMSLCVERVACMYSSSVGMVAP
jgi:hypothetical protein